MARWLACWLAGWFAGWRTGLLAGLMTDWFVDWLDCWLACSVVMAGWLAWSPEIKQNGKKTDAVVCSFARLFFGCVLVIVFRLLVYWVWWAFGGPQWEFSLGADMAGKARLEVQSQNVKESINTWFCLIVFRCWPNRDIARNNVMIISRIRPSAYESHMAGRARLEVQSQNVKENKNKWFCLIVYRWWFPLLS